jgi:hypothetical protein
MEILRIAGAMSSPNRKKFSERDMDGRGVASDEEGAMARTAYNKRAGEWLRTVRGKKRSAARFAGALSLVLETPVAPGALYSYENGTRQVPAAVLLAASEITGQAIAMDPAARKRLIDEVADELERRSKERGSG